MSADEPKAWETYQDVANYLLEKLSETLGLGLACVEGRQKLVGDVTEWDVEGKGVRVEDGSIIVIECRRYTTSRPNQEAMGGFAYRIGDIGAAGGIMVSPLGVQEGAKKIANREGIKTVRLDADSTTTDFMVEFLEKVVAGRSAKLGGTGTLTAKVEAVQPDKPEQS